MFRISVEKSFTAWHQLMLPDGSREKQHSHDWAVRVTVAASALDSMGLVMDFTRLASMMDEIVKPLAGSKLEELPQFRQTNASAENVALHIHQCLGPRLAPPVRLESVEVMETPGCWAKYTLD